MKSQKINCFVPFFNFYNISFQYETPCSRIFQFQHTCILYVHRTMTWVLEIQVLCCPYFSGHLHRIGMKWAEVLARCMHLRAHRTICAPIRPICCRSHLVEQPYFDIWVIFLVGILVFIAKLLCTLFLFTFKSNVCKKVLKRFRIWVILDNLVITHSKT